MHVFMRLCAVAIVNVSLVFGAAYPPIKGRALALTSHALADKVGQKILDEGGNAIDAAVAIGYALAVVHPSSGNLGGALPWCI
ncbi:hypothetical protein ASB1_09400 [Helicobacter heilmannii]|nr:hypothetical protein ASB1_09400 [Helicobacter heilmannii]